MKMKVLLLLALIVVLVAGCTTYPPNGTAITLTYPDGVAPGEVTDELLSESEDTRGIGTTTVRGLRVVNDMTVGGTLTVVGGVTGANVLTTGNQTVEGVKTFTDTGTFSGAVTVGGGYGSTGCTMSAAGVLQCNGAANIDGALYSVSPVLTKDANYSVAVADSGAIIKNTAVVSATFTLPAAAAGLNYCVFNYAGTDVIIEFTDSADVALNEVNSAGDSVTNTTAYDSICLTAIDAVNWITVSSIGTWADGN